MTLPGQRQRETAHRVYLDKVSPDDVRWLERDQRLKSEQCTELEKHFGDPEYSRSALAQCHQVQAEKRSQPASDNSEAKPSAPRAARERRLRRALSRP